MSDECTSPGGWLHRYLYRCPDCGETGYLDENGEGHCPAEEQTMEFILEVLTGVGLLQPHRRVP